MTPTLKVGIIASRDIRITFAGEYESSVPLDMSQPLDFSIAKDGMAVCQGHKAPEILFSTRSKDARFTIHNVTIGIGFHWQQQEHQDFHGDVMITVGDDGMLHAINIIDIERYLSSVVSSEMNANAPEEFLKAHAVISRSWVMAQIHPSGILSQHRCMDTGTETVRWYDRDAHSLFDVCADDHCQRYQGCTKASTPQVASAINATRGEVLMYGGELCDARFSKCCGGITERFSTCWQPVDFPYLRPVFDGTSPLYNPDISNENAAESWIKSRPDAFCANPPDEVLESVLNGYDLDTGDSYRWVQEYEADELADIVRSRTGVDYGRIVSITPLHRGSSGRIDRLEIRGTRHSRIIGKELEIRRTLSRSHLYSSAFTVTALDSDKDGIPALWRLEGAGWGHGVGLCQIGAAVMAYNGYSYRHILRHYFPGAEIETAY